jgi:anti-sigma factor RsiW
MSDQKNEAHQPIDLTCRDAYAFLQEYIEGELEAPLRAAFDQHLAQCSSCRRYLAQYEAVIAAMRSSHGVVGGAVDGAVDGVVDGAAGGVPAMPEGLLGAIRSLRPVA